MAITSETNQSKQLTTYKVTGDLTFTEIRTILESFHKGPPTSNALWDFSNAGGIRVTSPEIDELLEMAGAYEKIKQAGKTAIVVPKDTDLGLAAMAQSYAENLLSNLEVFEAVEEAYQWLAEGE